jgi:hypothetical protein
VKLKARSQGVIPLELDVGPVVVVVVVVVVDDTVEVEVEVVPPPAPVTSGRRSSVVHAKGTMARAAAAAIHPVARIVSSFDSAS